jgi:hypothetical protein
LVIAGALCGCAHQGDPAETQSASAASGAAAAPQVSDMLQRQSMAQQAKASGYSAWLKEHAPAKHP